MPRVFSGSVPVGHIKELVQLGWREAAHKAVTMSLCQCWLSVSAIWVSGWSRAKQSQLSNSVSDASKHNAFTNFVSMLGQRRRRWANFVPTLGEYSVFAGTPVVWARAFVYVMDRSAILRGCWNVLMVLIFRVTSHRKTHSRMMNPLQHCFKRLKITHIIYICSIWDEQFANFDVQTFTSFPITVIWSPIKTNNKRL